MDSNGELQFQNFLGGFGIKFIHVYNVIPRFKKKEKSDPWLQPSYSHPQICGAFLSQIIVLECLIPFHLIFSLNGLALVFWHSICITS